MKKGVKFDSIAICRETQCKKEREKRKKVFHQLIECDRPEKKSVQAVQKCLQKKKKELHYEKVSKAVENCDRRKCFSKK